MIIAPSFYVSSSTIRNIVLAENSWPISTSVWVTFAILLLFYCSSLILTLRMMHKVVLTEPGIIPRGIDSAFDS
jgi:hypothetical protein